jgi:hypothetical protein
MKMSIQKILHAHNDTPVSIHASQAYYHYEFWSEGDRLTKSTKYIPKRLLAQVQQMEHNKAPVREILGVLGVVQ